MTHIKDMQSINIYTFIDDTRTVYIQHPNLKEMVEAPELKDLPDVIDAMFKAGANPALQDALDRVKMLYALTQKKQQDKIMWHPV